MAASGKYRGRPHDAQGAKTAILNAAEVAFAESGFAGARIDAIAEAAGYNKSLIFHYFDDKLGLYTAVLKRADDQGAAMQGEIFESLLADPKIATDATAFRAFMDAAIRTFFDYFISNPRILRIVVWEEAAGWTTLAKISTVFDTRDVERFSQLLTEAQRAGLIRPEMSPSLVLIVAENICRTYVTSLPLFQMVGMSDPDVDVSSPETIARARDQIVSFILHGMLVDLPTTDIGSHVSAARQQDGGSAKVGALTHSLVRDT
jgi:TetR/AcrR family transcriptional regulator